MIGHTGGGGTSGVEVAKTDHIVLYLIPSVKPIYYANDIQLAIILDVHSKQSGQLIKIHICNYIHYYSIETVIHAYIAMYLNQLHIAICNYIHYYSIETVIHAYICT